MGDLKQKCKHLPNKPGNRRQLVAHRCRQRFNRDYQSTNIKWC